MSRENPTDPFASRPRYFSQVTSQLVVTAENMRKRAEVEGVSLALDGAVLLAAAAAIVTELRVIEDLLVSLNEKADPPRIALARSM